MHPVLFLAYDGCLHPEGVHHVNDDPQLRSEDHSLFEHAGLLAKLLEPCPEVRIVLSTPWARIYGLSRAKAFLPAALQTRVVGTTHEFCGDLVEWAELTEFDKVMRYVEGYGIRSWLALSCDKHHWPEAFRKNRIWVYGRVGFGEDRARVELAEKLKQLRHEVPSLGSVNIGMARDAEAVRMRLDAATTKIADARISQLSDSTRFQAAHDAVCCCASIMLTVEPQLVGLPGGQIFEELPTERLDDGTKAGSIALLQAWQEAENWEPRNIAPADVDVALKFAEAVLSATKSRLQGG
ncbi:hypothetical protein HI792_15870 [Ralstonia solanacearum]|nr:hypothetical protein HI792_15870 [Ralstonia solanacearum]